MLCLRCPAPKHTITYPSGPQAASTAEKHFVYDSATFSFGSPSYALGRLAEAYTGSNSAKITDLGFYYTNRGEVNSTFELTPHSGGYYQIAASYWANGATAAIATNLSGLPTWNYGVDPQGRLSTIVASSGQNPLTGTTYDGIGTTGITLGSGDSDSFSYDQKTGRELSYGFKVNGSTETGTLTWNLNGTLQKLAISDPFSSANTQTCTNVYDDLVRLTSNSCGSTWSNSFSYDVFGNIKKSGSSSFMPTYNSNNQYVALPSGTPSYNSNGNVQYDGLHTYSWDSEGKNVQLDTTVKMTYDAFGRWVEKNNSAQGQIIQAVYGPDGSRVAAMSGTTLVAYYLHMPGGAAAFYDSTGLSAYWHPDWLGTPRLFSSPTQTVLADVAFAAYGEQYQGPNMNAMFTGVAQEPEAADLLTFPARNLETVEGRWMSPDPAGFGAVDITNPQSFNRYAYVLGNPFGLVDPTGTADQPIKTSCPGCIITVYPILEKIFGLGSGGSNGCWLCGFKSPNRGSPYQPNRPAAIKTQPGPNNGQVPVHEPWHYGNYCGPGGMGSPINAIDTACQTHDTQFGNTGADWTNMQSDTTWNRLNKQQQIGVQHANQDLCNAMASIYPTIPSWNLSQSVAVIEIYSYFALAVPQGAQCHP